MSTVVTDKHFEIISKVNATIPKAVLLKSWQQLLCFLSVVTAGLKDGANGKTVPQIALNAMSCLDR